MQIDFDMPDDHYLKGEAFTIGLKNLAKIFDENLRLGMGLASTKSWSAPYLSLHIELRLDEQHPDQQEFASLLRERMLHHGIRPAVNRWGSDDQYGEVTYVVAQYRGHRSMDPDSIVDVRITGRPEELATVWPEMPARKVEADAGAE